MLWQLIGDVDNVNELTAISLAVAAALPMMANADVMITEYVEGSSNNKAIEIYNNGTAAVNWKGYKLVQYKNGSTVVTDIALLDGQTIGAKKLKAIKNPSDVLGLASDVDAINGSAIHFNGEDAVALVKDGAVVDIIGSA